MPAGPVSGGRIRTAARRAVWGGLALALISFGAGLAHLVDDQTALATALIGLGIVGTILGLAAVRDELVSRPRHAILGRLMTIITIPHLLLIAAVGIALIGAGVGALLGLPGF